MSLANIIEEILRTHTLDKGREISNENDQKLLQLLCGLIYPAYVHNQDTPAYVWTVIHPYSEGIVQYQIENSFGYRVEPLDSQRIGTNTIVVLWSTPMTGRVVVFGGSTTSNDPASLPIGLPTDGSWEDGAVDIQETDSIADAIDKINEALAAIHVPPEALQGTLTLLGSFNTALLSDGIDQGFTGALVPGQVFAYVTTNPAVIIQTPGSPADQFSDADKGLLQFWGLGGLLDSYDLGSAFDEGERIGSQSYPPDYGANSRLQISSVGYYNQVPKYQKGNFSVIGIPIGSPNGWVPPGEVSNIFLRHSITTPFIATRDTSSLVFFYDDGDIPSLGATPEIVEQSLSGVGSRYLDGVKYYIEGDVFSLSAHVQDSFNRTYLSYPTHVEMDGLTERPVALIEAGAGITTYAGDFDYDFTGTLASYWDLVAGPPVQNSGRLEMFHPGVPTDPFTHILRSKSRLIRKSGFYLNVLLTVDPDNNGQPSGGGYEAGISIQGNSGGAIEFVYRHSDAGDTYIEVYETDSLAVRTLLVSSGVLSPAIASEDEILFEVENDPGSDALVFYYTINGGSQEELGASTFSDFVPFDTRELRLSLTATNEIETNKPTYEVAFYDLEFVDGRMKVLEVIPSTTHFHELMSLHVTLDKSGDYSVNSTANFTPKSVRGTSITGSTTFLGNRLVNTKGIVSTAISEEFYDNDRRQPITNFPSYPYSAPAGLTGEWDDTIALPASEAHVFDGKLTYPSIDFNTLVNPYQPAQDASRDYSGTVGNVYYIRGFQPTNGPKSNGTLFLGGITAADITSEDLVVDIFIATLTDLLSLNTEYDSGSFTGSLGDGCRTTLEDVSGGVEIGFTLGGFSTQLPASATLGAVFVRITLTSALTPEVERMEMLGW